MPDPAARCIAFVGNACVADAPLEDVAVALRDLLDRTPDLMPLVFDAQTGRPVDLDLRGTAADIRARLHRAAAPPAPVKRGPGRPKLGVVAREVTLLPRHWEWLSAQPGGASVAIRRLVEEARRVKSDRDRLREAQDAAYRFISALAGNAPGYEEATRALFAGDRERFKDCIAGWPADIAVHAARLAEPALGGTSEPQPS